MDPSTTLPLSVTLAVLAAALTHATWNAVAHGIKDQTLAFALIGVGGITVAIPLIIVVTLPRSDCWPYLLASVAIHIFYNLLLMRCYRVGEFGQVYPLARGTSPLVVTILAAVFVGEHLALPQIAGVLIVSVGLAVLVLGGRRPSLARGPGGSGGEGSPPRSRGSGGSGRKSSPPGSGGPGASGGKGSPPGSGGPGGSGRKSSPPGSGAPGGSGRKSSPPGSGGFPRGVRGDGSPREKGVAPPGIHRAAFLAAVGTGLTIAAYTTVDGVGVRLSASPAGYIGWLMLLESLCVPMFALVRRRGVLLKQPPGVLLSGLAAGALSVLAYGLVLWAQTRGALAPIAALRETSVIFGAVIGALVFREPFGRTRIAATIIVVAGILLLNVS